MTARPIPFSGEMVRAILAGRKTQTRRVVQPQPDFASAEATMGAPYAAAAVVGVDATFTARPAIGLRNGPAFSFVQPNILCPFGRVGDQLWVRERWAVGACADVFSPASLSPAFWLHENGGLWYDADGAEPSHAVSPRGRWRSPRHMPRWASRITLEITDIRVQRLQEISEEDSRAEGAALWYNSLSERQLRKLSWNCYSTPLRAFVNHWHSINAKRGHGWEINPYVWAISFRASTPDLFSGAAA